MKLIKTLTLFLMAGLFIISCQKEYSEENGGGAGNATGTLKAAGTGECLPSSVQGIYIGGTTLSASNYINVTVNIATPGAYTITTDVVNGYSFSASGIATATGEQTIKLIAAGTPTADGANTFTVKFGTSQCNIVVDVFPAGTGNAVFSAIDCSGAVLNGTYQQGTATSGNTVQVEVTVATAGLYNISTTAANGVSFSGSGFLATGTHMVTLTANGGTPVSSGTVAYTVTAGTSTCDFDVTYIAGTTPPVGGFTWKFNVGATVYSGTCDDAVVITTPLNALMISGSSTTANGTLTIMLTNAGGAVTTGDYISSAMTGKSAVFTYSDDNVDFTAMPTFGNMTVKLTGFSAATDVVGTFSGTAISDVGGAGTPITITGGTFKANLP